MTQAELAKEARTLLEAGLSVRYGRADPVTGTVEMFLRGTPDQLARWVRLMAEADPEGAQAPS